MNLKSIIDSHTHSKFSPDSKTPLDIACQAAIHAGLGGIAFTDHLELDWPRLDFSVTPELIDKIISTRSTEINALRNKEFGALKILKGLELGFAPRVLDQASAIVQKYDFDFIILSTHAVDQEDIAQPEFFQNKTKEQVFSRYLATIYESASTFNDFDVIGHIGYLCRYTPEQDKALRYADFSDTLDAIFKKLIEKGKGIEVNTAGFLYNLGFSHPDVDSLKRYKELGGEIITIGSDAHKQEHIGNKFTFIVDQLQSIGFKYVTYFENRKPIFVKI